MAAARTPPATPRSTTPVDDGDSLLSAAAGTPLLADHARKESPIADEHRKQKAIREKRNTAMAELATLITDLHRNDLPKFDELRHTLYELKDDLFEKAKKADQEQILEDIITLTTASKTLFNKLSNPDKTRTESEAKAVITTFKDTAEGLVSFQETNWKITGRWIAKILVIAACSVLGAIAGAFIFGFVVSAMTAPPTAGLGAIIAGIPAALAGVAIGGTIGMNCGLTAAAAFGLVAGCGIGFFATNNWTKTRIDRIVKASENLATQFSPTPNIT